MTTKTDPTPEVCVGCDNAWGASKLVPFRVTFDDGKTAIVDYCADCALMADDSPQILSIEAVKI